MNIPRAGFEFTPEVLAGQLAEWEALRAELEEDARRAGELANTPSSGSEAASITVANLVSRSGGEFRRHNSAMLVFVNEHIRALTQARDTYVNGEENARHHLGRQGR